MNISEITSALTDNGGRRSGFDRRQFSYTTHIPERRIDADRRCLSDRRNLTNRRYLSERRALNDGLCALKKMIGVECRANQQERRSSNDRRAALTCILVPA